MIAQERHGQLVLGRLGWPFLPGEVAAMLAEQKRIQADHPGPSVVCLDARGAKVVPRDVADGLIVALSTRRVRRIAIVAAHQVISEMQLERILRSAEQEKGRVFQDADSAREWLGELLTREEQRLLGDFLGLPTSAPRATP